MTHEEALRRLQAEELEVLLAIDRVCERSGITYFLMSGSALGALRHGGFIPWDDDVDVGMLREDYERFLEVAPAELPAGLSVHTAADTPGYAAMFAKVWRDDTVFETAETAEAGCPQGIFVDVFPLDVVPEDARARRRQLRGAMVWQRVSYLWHAGTITVPHVGALGAAERLACRAAHRVVRAALSPEAIRARFERVVELGEEDRSGAGRYVALSWPYVEPIDRDVLVPPTRHAFEGHMLPVPARPEDYLRTWYGEWRRLPPPDERRTHLPRRIVFGDGATWEAPSRT